MSGTLLSRGVHPIGSKLTIRVESQRLGRVAVDATFPTLACLRETGFQACSNRGPGRVPRTFGGRGG